MHSIPPTAFITSKTSRTLGANGRMVASLARVEKVFYRIELVTDGPELTTKLLQPHSVCLLYSPPTLPDH